MKSFVYSLVVALVFIGAYFTQAYAGKNVGTVAWLSWSDISLITDRAPSEQSQVIVRMTRSAPGMTYKGGEVDVTWQPVSDGMGCFDHIGNVWKVGPGTVCAYMNRGTVVPVVIVETDQHLHISWTNSIAMTGCTGGGTIYMQFETDVCADGTGCFSLNSASILDDNGDSDVCTIGNSIITAGGGGSYHCDQPPSTQPPGAR